MSARGGIPVFVCCAGLLAAAEATAIPLLDGFGGVDGYGTPDHCVAMGNDNSYAVAGASEPTAIDLAPAFPGGLSFFGRTLDHFYLNTNGNITFAAPLATATPTAYPIADQPMIAPWWADVDTRRGGTVCFHLEPGRLVATWHDVGPNRDTANLRDDFQLILTARPLCERRGEFDVEFRYNRCEWSDGGGGDAQVGFDAGNRMNFVSLPTSRSAEIASVCGGSNVPGGAPGLYRFQVRIGYIGGGCSGDGLPCTLESARGRCALAIGQCVDGGASAVCTSVYAPRARACDGYDNDCDGALDDDCPAGEVCDRARCLPRCGPTGACPAGTACTPAGGCVETACLNVECPTGQRCDAGVCLSLCDATHCGPGERCDDGRCVGACEGVVCEAPGLCDPDPTSPYVGQCVAHCSCNGCDAGRVCGASGLCVSEVPPPSADGGAVADVPLRRDASVDATARDVPATPLDAGESDAPATALDASTRDAGTPVGGRLVDAGCGCRAGTTTSSSPATLVALAWVWSIARRRRFTASREGRP